MNDIIKAAVIGGDMRQAFLTSSLIDAGFEVSAYGVKGVCPNIYPTLTEALHGADIVILPFPVSPDGVFLNAICDNCNIRLDDLVKEVCDANIKTVIGGGFKSATVMLAEKHGLKIFDYGQSEAVKIKNALCTAEGALEIAMRELPINIHGSDCAVLGYGRIGKLLAIRLKALGASVTVYARKDEALALADCDGFKSEKIQNLRHGCDEHDIIFNTVPTLVLGKDELSHLKNECLIIDLASSPGGVDFAEVKRLGLTAIWALSLPGKCSPKSAAKIICDAVIKHLEGEGGDVI